MTREAGSAHRHVEPHLAPALRVRVEDADVQGQQEPDREGPPAHVGEREREGGVHADEGVRRFSQPWLDPARQRGVASHAQRQQGQHRQPSGVVAPHPGQHHQGEEHARERHPGVEPAPHRSLLRHPRLSPRTLRGPVPSVGVLARRPPPGEPVIRGVVSRRWEPMGRAGRGARATSPHIRPRLPSGRGCSGVRPSRVNARGLLG